MRWYQYRLRTLFGVMSLICIGLGGFKAYVATYYGQAATIALIESLGGTCQTIQAERWLRWASEPRHVLQVNLAVCDDPEKYIAAIAGLPKVELLIVGGRNFMDEHSAQLHGLLTLKGLILDSTSVSKDGLVSLRAALPGADIYASQRGAIAALEIVGRFGESTSNGEHSALRELAGDAWFKEAQNYVASSAADDARLERLKNLTKLDGLCLAGTKVTDAGLGHLKGLSELRLLSIRGTKVTDAGLEHLKALSELRWLFLTDTKLTDAGLEHLKRVAKLYNLDLRGTKVTDAGLEHLKGLTKLNELDLRGTQVTDAGLEQLRGLWQLRSLYLNRTQVTTAGVKKLRRALPSCQIEH